MLTREYLPRERIGLERRDERHDLGGAQVTAANPSGVTKDEFYVNGVLKSTDTTALWSCTWDTKPYRGKTVTLTA